MTEHNQKTTREMVMGALNTIIEEVDVWKHNKCRFCGVEWGDDHLSKCRFAVAVETLRKTLGKESKPATTPPCEVGMGLEKLWRDHDLFIQPDGRAKAMWHVIRLDGLNVKTTLATVLDYEASLNAAQQIAAWDKVRDEVQGGAPLRWAGSCPTCGNLGVIDNPRRSGKMLECPTCGGKDAKMWNATVAPEEVKCSRCPHPMSVHGANGCYAEDAECECERPGNTPNKDAIAAAEKYDEECETATPEEPDLSTHVGPVNDCTCQLGELSDPACPIHGEKTSPTQDAVATDPPKEAAEALARDFPNYYVCGKGCAYVPNDAMFWSEADDEWKPSIYAGKPGDPGCWYAIPKSDFVDVMKQETSRDRAKKLIDMLNAIAPNGMVVNGGLQAYIYSCADKEDAAIQSKVDVKPDCVIVSRVLLFTVQRGLGKVMDGRGGELSTRWAQSVATDIDLILNPNTM